MTLNLVILNSDHAKYLTDVPETKVTTSLSASLHGLQHFTNYSVQLLAFTSAGDGIRSLPKFCVTEETGKANAREF